MLTVTEVAKEKLKELGYDPGPPDGIRGKKTISAIKRFQGDNGLVAILPRRCLSRTIVQQ
jgi:peptidoglycan hydrolase-like protein with peptidoglycan-binding domain